MKASSHPGTAADDLARGRKFSAEELQMMLLALLGNEPRHGYQLMQQIETRSGGGYRPSAGVVYPALTRLEGAGYTRGIASGKRKRYALTEAGLRQLHATRQQTEVLWAKLDFLSENMALVRRAFADEEALSQRDSQDPSQSLRAALENLETAVISATRGSSAERSRIVALLERATQEIAGVGTESETPR